MEMKWCKTIHKILRIMQNNLRRTNKKYFNLPSIYLENLRLQPNRALLTEGKWRTSVILIGQLYLSFHFDWLDHWISPTASRANFQLWNIEHGVIQHSRYVENGVSHNNKIDEVNSCHFCYHRIYHMSADCSEKSV